MAATVINVEKSAQRAAEYLVMETLHGEMDVERHKKSVRNLVEAGFPKIWLDFSPMHAVSSDTINFLLWCEMECLRSNVSLGLRNVSPDLLRIFRFSGLNQVFEIHAHG